MSIPLGPRSRFALTAVALALGILWFAPPARAIHPPVDPPPHSTGGGSGGGSTGTGGGSGSNIGGSGGGGHIASVSPEPTSLVIGFVGAGLACVAGAMRRRPPASMA